MYLQWIKGLLYVLMCFNLQVSDEQASQTLVFQQLADLNVQWKLIEDLPDLYTISQINFTENEVISLHLSLVEGYMRSHTSQGLSESQLSNRMKLLNDLHDYWKEGRFPRNSYRGAT